MDKRQLLKLIDAKLAEMFAGEFRRVEDTLWTRDKGWRTERIEAVPRKETFVVSANVVIPPRQGTPFEFSSICSVNLPILAACSDGAYRYSEGESLLSRLESDIELSADWFRRFDTPAKCLDFVQNDDEQNPESPSSQHCCEYLQKVLSEKED